MKTFNIEDIQFFAFFTIKIKNDSYFHEYSRSFSRLNEPHRDSTSATCYPHVIIFSWCSLPSRQLSCISQSGKEIFRLGREIKDRSEYRTVAGIFRIPCDRAIAVIERERKLRSTDRGLRKILYTYLTGELAILFMQNDRKKERNREISRIVDPQRRHATPSDGHSTSDVAAAFFVAITRRPSPRVSDRSEIERSRSGRGSPLAFSRIIDIADAREATACMRACSRSICHFSEFGLPSGTRMQH